MFVFSERGENGSPRIPDDIRGNRTSAFVALTRWLAAFRGCEHLSGSTLLQTFVLISLASPETGHARERERGREGGREKHAAGIHLLIPLNKQTTAADWLCHSLGALRMPPSCAI
jgi:hypothetical protein